MKKEYTEDIYTKEEDVYVIPEEDEIVAKGDDARQTFQVQTEDGQIHTAELLSVVEIDGKEYAVYSIPGIVPDKVDIMASYVVQDEEGYDMLCDITDLSDKEKISGLIKSLL